MILETKPLRKVLFPTEVHYVYAPKLGARGSKEAAEKIIRGQLKEWLNRQDQTVGKNLKAGDLVYVELEHHNSEDLGPGRIVSEYKSNFYLHEVVDDNGQLMLKTLTRIPAAPAASRVWLSEGTLLPISKRGLVYRVFDSYK